MSLNPRMVKESFAHIEPVADKAAAYFYARLFAENPRLRPLFPAAMDGPRERLLRTLTRIVWGLDSPDDLADYLGRVGRQNRKFGVVPEHYALMGRTLLTMFGRFAGEAWTSEAKESWSTAYNTAASIMIDAAQADAADTPPWWIAEVVDHERRTPDVAVLTVRPLTHFDHVAGQYAAVQTARWPRIWRPYYIANAPRTDGLVRFHVRAMPGGWVSGSLVRHTRAGDTVLLGPPAGKLAVDPESGRDLLCVAGGAGLAPLKAIVEQVIDAGGRRAIQLVVGARSERDLYDMAELEALARAYPRLRVLPVMARSPGLLSMVPDVIGRFRVSRDPDVYVAGPPALVSKSVAVLQDLGVPTERLHYDPVDDPVDGPVDYPFDAG